MISQVKAMGFFDNKIVQIVIAIIIPFIGAWVVGYGAQKNMYPWYDLIQRPTWGPPDWVFAPVWSFLYASMGYASYRVYSNGSGFSGVARAALLLYIAQLLLNWTWTWAQLFQSVYLFHNILFSFHHCFFQPSVLQLAHDWGRSDPHYSAACVYNTDNHLFLSSWSVGW